MAKKEGENDGNLLSSPNAVNTSAGPRILFTCCKGADVGVPCHGLLELRLTQGTLMGVLG